MPQNSCATCGVACEVYEACEQCQAPFGMPCLNLAGQQRRNHVGREAARKHDFYPCEKPGCKGGRTCVGDPPAGAAKPSEAATCSGCKGLNGNHDVFCAPIIRKVAALETALEGANKELAALRRFSDETIRKMSEDLLALRERIVKGN